MYFEATKSLFASLFMRRASWRIESIAGCMSVHSHSFKSLENGMSRTVALPSTVA